jgi:3-hydroxyisobutyrate dehydrogenase-like beta-hydroxyacid dehydrogenase
VNFLLKRAITLQVPIIGFIGFGEAAYLISKGLLRDGIKDIYAFDINSKDQKLGQVITARSQELGVELTDSLEELFNNSDIVICATSAKAAELIAKDASQYLKPHHIYVDINATSPMVKESIADVVATSSASFVDAAVMESVPLKQHKVPIFISGSGAMSFQNLMSQYGMNLTYINETAGSASAIKMIRSVFMKGFTMLLLETLDASHQYGVTDLIMNSIHESITNKPLEETANMLLTRTSIHAERRVAEMNDVIKTLENLQVDSSLSQATKAKLQNLVDINLKEYFNNELPGHYVEVLNALKQLL